VDRSIKPENKWKQVKVWSTHLWWSITFCWIRK
jgi:hypothetical protein